MPIFCVLLNLFFWLQQEQVLGELVHYANQDPAPHDANATCETLAYLEACNLLFEQGFLSHDRIRGTNSDVIKNINRGYEYFSKWLDSILKKGKQTLQSYFCHIQVF